MHRIMLVCIYEGTAYHGWQKQSNISLTVEETLQQAVEKIARHTVQLIACGRTDKGVHALRQIMHFDTPVDRPHHAWIMGVNSYLPADIVVKHAQEVSIDFHARFSAIKRFYRYILYSARQRPVLYRDKVGWIVDPLNVDGMNMAAQLLLGEHDFSSFRSVDCQSKSPVKTLYHANVYRWHDLIIFDFAASGFLQHMVRNIVGALIQIGRGRLDISAFEELFHAKSRQQAPSTFSAKGLYFLGAAYPNHFQLVLPAISSSFWGKHEFLY